MRERGLKLYQFFFCHLTTLSSLPVRERGLKYKSIYGAVSGNRSLPVRERGLKFYRFYQLVFRKKSLPVRERGLKFLE